MPFIKTFVESHNDQGSLPIGELQKLHILNPDPLDPSKSKTDAFEFVAPLDGSRTGPGLNQLSNLSIDDLSSGYLYADQPEATVYIRKKQWRGDEWTYTTHTETEKAGKAKQISVRSLLSRIITRKIEWMGMHEHFTKANDVLSALQTIVSRPVDSPAYRDLVADSNVAEVIKDITNTLLPAEFAPGPVEEASVTRYFVTQGTGRNTFRFNGIIELSNVSNISTSLNLSGDGTANLTLENPGNIFYITSSDIDLAMQEDPYLKSGDFVGNNWKNPKDKDDKEFGKENREEQLGNLQYFRGRYYQPNAVARFFNKGNDIFDRRAKDLSIVPNRDDKEKTQVRNLLRKHFLGKYVFEVFDHVWIWLTSPSKTIFSVPLRGTDQTVQVIQSPDRGPIAELQRIERQLEEQGKNQTFTDEEVTALRKRKTQLISQLKGLKTTEIQQNTIGSAIEFQRYQASLDSGLPVDGTHPGIQEQQYQVFEGIIISVTESYSDGRYQLQLSCKDVMHYLTLSRIMIKPSLRGTSAQAPKGFLNNPIWRERDKKKAVNVEVGEWKSGSFVTFDEFLFGNVDKKQQESNIFAVASASSTTPLEQGTADHGVFLSTQPFAGVDAANVISFLITGIPYNFDTFLRSGLEFGRLFVDQQDGTDNIPGVTDGIFAMIRRQMSGAGDEKGQNEHLGDFKPYTTIVGGDENSLQSIIEKDKADLAKKQADFLVIINDLSSLTTKEKLKIEDFVNRNQLILPLLEKQFTTTDPPEQGKVSSTLRPMVVDLDQAVNRASGFNQDFINYPPQLEAIKRAKEQQKIVDEGTSESIIKNALSANPLEATKAAIVSNKDENLLVIDASYSASVNVQAFNRELASSQSAFSLWQSEYDTPLTTCQKAAEAIDFEFFANSQGHLIFKPPTYNRVLKEHLIEFADYEEPTKSLIAARYAGANGRKFEDVVRKQSILETAVSGYTSALQRLRAQNVERFRFLAHPDRADIPSALKKITPKIVSIGTDSIETPVGQDVLGAASLKASLDDAQEQIGRAVSDPTLTDDQQYEKLVKLNVGAGLRVEELLLAVAVNVEKLRKDIEETVFVRPENAIIVDENRIHIITDGDLISTTFSEQPPKFTRLDVQGQPDLVNLAEAGETYYWAGGVDFDLWRSYGFLQESKTKPQFHSGPACKPYCQALLGRQWGRIFTGSLSVRGDSKYRLGDCVFIESRDMYYYVEGIQHSFTYGSGYTTSLTLSFGRRRGWYIPHPFDTLGDLVSRASFDQYEEHKANIRASLEDPDITTLEEEDAIGPNTIAGAVGGELSTSENTIVFRRQDIQPALILEGEDAFPPDQAIIAGQVMLRFFTSDAADVVGQGITLVFKVATLHTAIDVESINTIVAIEQQRAGESVSYSSQITEAEATDIKTQAGILLADARAFRQRIRDRENTSPSTVTPLRFER